MPCRRPRGTWSEGPGRCGGITAAIVVNDGWRSSASKEGDAVSGSHRASADEVRNLTALAQAAISFDSARGDTVTVSGSGV